MAEPTGLQGSPDPGRLGLGVRAQAMIDRQGQDIAPARLGPGVQQQRQSHTVGAAGHRHGDPGRRLERAETGHNSGKGFIA